MAKILHLIPDEKVTDNVIENFEEIFNDNIFYVLGDENNRKYCKSKGDNIIFRNEDFFVRENISNEVKGVIIHGLNYIFAKMILGLNHNVKVAWFAWGYDIYFLPKISKGLYNAATYEYLCSRDSKFELINRVKNNALFRFLYYKLVKGGEDYYTIYEKAHKRIDFFCTYIKEDYDLFISRYNTSASFLDVGYFSIKQYLAGQESLKIKTDAQNILIGNSNSLECNHLDVFEILNINKPLSNGSKWIVPLNYGNDFSYREQVVEKGIELCGDKFVPLVEFMERQDYFNLLRSCSIAIFYHNRQQAMGNIIAFLYMGGRVYLSKKNPVYKYLNRIGIKVFDLDSEFKLYGVSKLEDNYVLINREILEKYFDKHVIYEQNKKLVEKLTNVNR